MNERAHLECKWKYYKYEVLMHSHHHYLEIRSLLKGSPSSSDLEALIESALQKTPTLGSVTNAYLHMWGYVKDKASSREKRVFLEILSNGNKEELRQKMLLLSEKYKVDYLLESSILKEKD